MKLPENLYVNGFARKDEPGEKIDIDTLDDIRAFIACNFIQRSTFNYQHSSYDLKRMVENKLGRYIHNGEFIAAMILEGYLYKHTDSVNAYFNIGKESMKEIAKQRKV